MRLMKFRVTNFRSVVDSGWIDVDPVTALIGVNESGKTNLLLPLWKLNPAGEGDIKPTSDYPKANYASVRADPSAFPFISADFDAPELAFRLATMTKLAQDSVSVVRVTKYFDGTIDLDFPLYKQVSSVPNDELKIILDAGKTEIEGISALAKESATKPALVQSIANVLLDADKSLECDATELSNIISQLRAAIPEQPAATSSIVPRFVRLIEDLQVRVDSLNAASPTLDEKVRQFALSKIPKFVYYSNYGNLDSEIYLPHVVQNLKRADLGARELAKARTLKVLFSFVKLAPSEILELGRDFQMTPQRAPSDAEIEAIATKKRERTILLNSAGTDLTKRFRDWWKQGDYTFEFQADGDHFRIWVSDKRRPEKVELEDRSTGLQWFLSFYLVFLVESAGDHRNSILLLDEPGLSLHPLAQRDLSAFFENLGTTNQLIYTTHSPFLVDADMLDRARKVFIAEDGSTKASADLRRGNEDPRKSGATYAIFSALNMNVAESILYGCAPVIVEGPSDQHYLSTIKAILISARRIAPKRELVFPPAHGAKNAKIIASILTGRTEILPSVLLDGDAVGIQMAKDLRSGLYANSKDKVLNTDSFAGFPNSEIEDLFDPKAFSLVVDRWQRKSEIEFADVHRAGSPIIPQIQAWASSQSIKLDDGWKVELSRIVKTRILAQGHDKIDVEFLDRWQSLFEKLLD